MSVYCCRVVSRNKTVAPTLNSSEFPSLNQSRPVTMAPEMGLREERSGCWGGLTYEHHGHHIAGALQRIAGHCPMLGVDYHTQHKSRTCEPLDVVCRVHTGLAPGLMCRPVLVKDSRMHLYSTCWRVWILPALRVCSWASRPHHWLLSSHNMHNKLPLDNDPCYAWKTECTGSTW